MDKKEDEVVKKVIIDGVITENSPLKIKVIGDRGSEKTIISCKYSIIAILFREKCEEEFIGELFSEIPVIERGKIEFPVS